MSPIDTLRRISPFCDFAHAKMADNAESWIEEAQHGSGFMQIVAAAVVEIGGDSRDC